MSQSDLVSEPISDSGSNSGSDSGSNSGVDSRMLAALGLGAMLAPLGSTMISTALPAMGRDLHVELSTLTQWVVSSYLLISIVAQSPGGKLGDLLGHRHALLLGQIVYAIGIGFGFSAHAVWMLVLGRVFTAGGGALIVPASMAILRNQLPPERRGRAFGVFGGLLALAAAIGPVLGGELTARFSWRAIFAVTVIPLGVSVFLSRVNIAPKDVAPPASRRLSIDVRGILLLAIALSALVLAPKMNGTSARYAALVGFVFLLVFGWWERRVADPVVALDLFRHRAFSAGSAIVALQNLSMYAVIFQLPAFFSDVRGIGTNRTGRVLLGMMLSMVITAPIGGRLSEVFGARWVVGIGSLTAMMGLWRLHDAAALTHPSVALIPLIAIGVGLGLSTAPSQAVAIGAIVRQRSGMASGVFSTMRYLGGITGIAILGACLRGVHGLESIPRHTLAMKLFTGSMLASALVALFLPMRAAESAD